MTVQTEGPTHIITFDDNETCAENGNVLHSLMTSREDAWHVDMALRKYQDQKGILVDYLLDSSVESDHDISFDAEGSADEWNPAWRNYSLRMSRNQAVPEVSRHCISMEHTRQTADRVCQGDYTSNRRWFHKITRASSSAAAKSHVAIRSRSSTMESHAIPSTLSVAAAAVAKSSQRTSRQTSEDGGHAVEAHSVPSEGFDAVTSSGTSDFERWVNALPVVDDSLHERDCREISNTHSNPRRVNFELMSQPPSCQHQSSTRDSRMQNGTPNPKSAQFSGGLTSNRNSVLDDYSASVRHSTYADQFRSARFT